MSESKQEKKTAQLVPYQFKKGQSGNPGGTSGRVAGFKHYMAQIYAQLLDARVDAKGIPVAPGEDGIPLPMAALSKYAELVLNPQRDKGVALIKFVEEIIPSIDKLDSILSGQKQQDLKFLAFLIFRYCFDEQQAVLMTKKHMIILICGRRAGKTVVIAALLILIAISHEKGDCLYLGRTSKSAYDIIWRTLVDILGYISIPYTANLTDQTITFNTGVKIFVKGTATKADIENLRGLGLRIAVKDESQSDSHGKLKMLVEEILTPATKDYEGSQIVIAGSPPRIEGSYQEEKYAENDSNIARFNWNMSVNPHIPHHETVLQETLANDFGGNENDTVYQREHLGRIGVYDTEALVFRITAGNHYQEAQLVAWIASQPPSDIFFSGGVDYGFDDQDSCVILMASVHKPERFKLYGYKGNRTGITDFANQMKLGITRVLGNPIFAPIPKENRAFTWYCDTEGLGKKITYELAQQFGLSVAPAYQGQPEIMLEMLQDEVKSCRWKHPAPKEIVGKLIIDDFEDEAKHIIFERNDAGQLTRRIDDDVYHPEQTKSILYAMRYIWLRSKAKIGGGK